MELDQWDKVRAPDAEWGIAPQQQVQPTVVSPAALPVHWVLGAGCGVLHSAGFLVAAVVEDDFYKTKGVKYAWI